MKLIALLGALILLAGTVTAKQATTNIKVPKMDCDACAVVIKQALAKTNGVKSTTINTGARLVTVVYDDAVVTAPELRKKIEGTGFAVDAPRSESRK